MAGCNCKPNQNKKKKKKKTEQTNIKHFELWVNTFGFEPNVEEEDGSCFYIRFHFWSKSILEKCHFRSLFCQMSTNMILVKYSIVRNGQVMVIDW